MGGGLGRDGDGGTASVEVRMEISIGGFISVLGGRWIHATTVWLVVRYSTASFIQCIQ